MIRIDELQEPIARLCDRLNVARLDLIGSVARDDFSEASDIDVLVSFIGSEQLFNRYFTLKEELEQLFRRDVDVVMENAIQNPIIRESINHDRIVLYAS